MKSVDSQSLPGWLDVSRETHAKMSELLALVTKWNRAINLVSAASLAEGWNRHVLDSAQLWLAARVSDGHWLDLGSGGGFPGLVVAIIAQEKAPNMLVSLVEADKRKSVFLGEAARQLGQRVVVHADRVEALEGKAASVLSARALAPLESLLLSARRHLAAGGVALFPKGRNVEAELSDARARWSFDCEALTSMTDQAAVILRIENIQDV